MKFLDAAKPLNKHVIRYNIQWAASIGHVIAVAL
jgi:hypothetical protein